MSTLKKARFQFETGENAWGPFMDVQYNPENLSVDQSASWNKQSASGGSSVSPIQFQSTNPRSISRKRRMSPTRRAKVRIAVPHHPSVGGNKLSPRGE